jgi:hypothetical protein
VAVTNGFPWLATGAQQDSGAVWVRSRSFTATLSTRDWQGACAGGESGYTAPDPMDPDKLFGGTVSTCRLDVNGSAQQIPPPPGPEKAREDWTQPLVFSKADPTRSTTRISTSIRRLTAARTGRASPTT